MSTRDVTIGPRSDEVSRQLNDVIHSCRMAPGFGGETASYIPALQHVNASALGISIRSTDGFVVQAGDWSTPFTMQSVSKVINLLAAFESCGIDRVLDKVDVEPTGDAFDSIIRLESNQPGKPFNPMINAGAITIASMLPGSTPDEKVSVFLTLLEKMIGRIPSMNQEVFDSEWDTAFRNRALANYLKALGYLDSDVDQALTVYTTECATEATTDDLARIGLVLSHDGYDPITERQIVSQRSAQITKSLMTTCGMYNASGNFAAAVGIPAKSGVSGAILASVPNRKQIPEWPTMQGCGIGVYNPSIDRYGNSVGGVALLRELSRLWGLNIF